jgi:hypothetical protein
MQIHSFARGCLAASVCWLVAAVPAQSAVETKPAAPARTRALTPSAPATAPASGDEARLRLAEVMAMLEEDQLTPEQRRRALAKLAEVQAQLRTPPPEPPPAAMPPAAPAAPAKPPVLLFALPRESQAPTTSYREQPATAVLAERVQLLRPAADNPESLSRSKDAESGRRTVVQGKDGVIKVEGKEGAKIYVLEESAGAPLVVLQEARITRVPETEVPVIAGEVEVRQQQAKQLRAQALRIEQQAAKAKEDLQRNLVRVREQAERSREQAVGSLAETARTIDRQGVVSRRLETEAAEVPARTVRPEAASKALPAESAEVQAILEQMRAEMREIRAVIEDLRGQLPPSEAEATVVRRPARTGR